jgi:hypothetical protein
VDVIGPRGTGPHCVLSQAEHSMEVVFETLREKQMVALVIG